MDGIKTKQTNKDDLEGEECLAIPDRTVFHTFPRHSISKPMDRQDHVNSDLSSLLYESLSPLTSTLQTLLITLSQLLAHRTVGRNFIPPESLRCVFSTSLNPYPR